MIRRRFGVSTAALVFAFLIACGGGDDQPAPTVPVPAETPAPTPTAAAQPTAIPTAAPVPTRAPTPAPAATPTPTSEPTPTPSALRGAFFLDRLEPEDPEVFADSPELAIAGRTRLDAVVTVNDDLAEPDADGLFRHTVTLEIGVNVIEVVASVSAEEQDSFVVTAIYIP